jgi:1,4-dihydroxy-2-naphthoate octaprenyltransferase
MASDKKAGNLLAWLRITRLQFYPMTWLAYTMGAVAYSAASGELNLVPYLLGYLILFLIELCTILANEYFDYPSDRNNQNFSIFTGGTRVLVEGQLSFGEVRSGIIIILATIPVFGFLLLKISAGVSQSAIASLLFVGLLFGLGYTVPPLKFSYRGVGELVVAGTHSLYVIICGFVFQGGLWQDPLPWLLSIPLFFAVLAGNTLAGIPDRQADLAAMKKSIAVMFGSRVAVLLAIWSVCMAFFSAIALLNLQVIRLSPFYWWLLVLPHGLALLYFLLKLLRANDFDKRIDVIMAVALGYIIWFGLLPLISFLR